MGDLEEFGFNKNAACGNMCMPFNSESWEEYTAKARLFNDRMYMNIMNQVQLAQCHPYVQANVMPKVQYVW